jgi:hypothetical protein
MSAIEIIDEIKKLPPDEQRRVAVYLEELRKAGAKDPASAAVSVEFKRAADEVFKTNDELFRKLAK